MKIFVDPRIWLASATNFLPTPWFPRGPSLLEILHPSMCMHRTPLGTGEKCSDCEELKRLIIKRKGEK